MRSTLSSGTRVQYTQPPNGSLNGTPSIRTSERLTPLGPIPRSDTPCAVGCADRLLVRRNRLNVGTSRSTSSATMAGERRIVSLSITLTLAGTSPRRCSVRVGVTVTDSKTVAGARTTSISLEPESGWTFSEKPTARTTRLAPAAGGGPSVAKRPSGPVTVCCTTPAGVRTRTDAPDTTPPDESLTTPDTTDCAAAATGREKAKSTAKNIRIAGDIMRLQRIVALYSVRTGC